MSGATSRFMRKAPVLKPRRFLDKLTDSREEAVSTKCRSLMASLSVSLQFERSKCRKVRERHRGDARCSKTEEPRGLDERLREISEGMWGNKSSKGLTESSVIPVFSRLNCVKIHSYLMIYSILSLGST